MTDKFSQRSMPVPMLQRDAGYRCFEGSDALVNRFLQMISTTRYSFDVCAAEVPAAGIWLSYG